MNGENELRRIRDYYNSPEWREQSINNFSFFDESNLYLYQARDRAIIQMLKRNGVHSLRDKKILDIGCGRGVELNNFIRYGARSSNLYGVDLMPYRIEDAIENNRGINFSCGDASKLGFGNETFDLILQILVFTSIVDDGLKGEIASEMVRCLKPSGLIVWFDFLLTNPFKNDKNVKAIGRGEIERLFPGHAIDIRKVVLTRPLVKILAPWSVIVCRLLEKIRFLNYCYVAVIKKQFVT